MPGSAFTISGPDTAAQRSSASKLNDSDAALCLALCPVMCLVLCLFLCCIFNISLDVSETSIFYTEDGDSSLYSIGGSSRSLFLSSLYAINTYIDFPKCLLTHACFQLSCDQTRRLETAFSQQVPTTGKTSFRSCCSLHLPQWHFVI